MANGRKHEVAIVVTGSATSLLGLLTLDPQVFLGQLTGHVLSTFYNPDTDLALETRGENQVEHFFETITGSPTFGKFAKAIITTLTAPYAAFLEHRSIYSHMPILSDVIRHLYLEFWLFLLQIIIGQDVPTLWNSLWVAFHTQSLVELTNWFGHLGSIGFLSYFVALVVQTCVHSLVLDGGKMVVKNKKTGKGQNKYFLGRGWYETSRKMFK